MKFERFLDWVFDSSSFWPIVVFWLMCVAILSAATAVFLLIVWGIYAVL